MHHFFVTGAEPPDPLELVESAEAEDAIEGAEQVR
jgi:hypothetical protein